MSKPLLACHILLVDILSSQTWLSDPSCSVVLLGIFQINLKYHLFEVQTEIVERLALEDGAGVFKLIKEQKVWCDIMHDLRCTTEQQPSSSMRRAI